MPGTQVVDGSPAFLKLLTHERRWELLATLGQSDLRVQELVALARRPQNLVSYHLRQRRDGAQRNPSLCRACHAGTRYLPRWAGAR